MHTNQDPIAPTEESREAAVTDWLVTHLAEVLGEPREKIDLDLDINSFGLGSVQLVSLVGELEDWLDLELPATLLWDHSTLRGVIGYIVGLDKD